MPFSSLTQSSSGDSSLTFGSPSAEVAIGDAEGTGTSSQPPRSDHQHAVPAAASGDGATDSAPGDAEADGTATTPARSDHVHGREPWGTATQVGSLAFGAAAAAGATGAVADVGHVHPTPANPVPAPAASGDVLTATGTAAGDYDWAPPAQPALPAPAASGDVLTATGTAAGDYDWAPPAQPALPAPAASGDVLTATGTAAGDYDWAAVPNPLPAPGASGEVLTATGTAVGDYDWAEPAGSAGALLARVQYAPTTGVTYALSTSAMSAVDTTNLTISFVAPASGDVILRASGGLLSPPNDGAVGAWAGWLDHGTTTQEGLSTSFPDQSSYYAGPLVSAQLLSGLTPGDTYQFDLAAVAADATTLAVGGATGEATLGSPMLLEVIAA